MTQKKTNTVTIIKWCASEPGAYCTGIFGVYYESSTAKHYLMLERESLIQNGYTIIKRLDNEIIFKNQEDDRTMQLYIETLPII